jgi:hypothetical protein
MKYDRLTKSSLALLCCIAALACTGVSGTGKAEIPDSPDGTVQVVASELANNRPQILWEALPVSYQQDISQLTHDLANKMDPELYAKLFAFAQKTSAVLLEKKEYILGSSMVSLSPEDLEDLESGWDTSLVALDTLLHSEISNIETLKTIDFHNFLSTTGTALMDQAAAASKQDPDDPFENEFKAKINGLQVELIESGEDTATVKLTVPEEDPEELKLVKVENRWVPADLAETWDEEIAEAKQQIAELDQEEMDQVKMQAMLFLAMAESFVDQLAAIQSSEEFDQLAQNLFGSFMGGATPPQDITGK